MYDMWAVQRLSLTLGSCIWDEIHCEPHEGCVSIGFRSPRRIPSQMPHADAIQYKPSGYNCVVEACWFCMDPWSLLRGDPSLMLYREIIAQTFGKKAVFSTCCMSMQLDTQ
jgi:hypothetical protein